MLRRAMDIMAQYYGCGIDAFESGENLVLHAPPDRPFFRMIGFGNGTVVSAHEAFAPWCEEWFDKVDGIFSFDAPSLVEIGLEMRKFGSTLGEISEYYLPLRHSDCASESPHNLDTQFHENEKTHQLHRFKGFDNALTYDNPESTRLVIIANCEEGPCAMAGASSNHEGMWGIGVDVLPGFRKQGVGTFLVYSLTAKLLGRDILPMYPTWYSNIGPRSVALNAGYRPAWVEVGCETLPP